ncbi:hypothetical protein OIO90_006342 [Microbotryomycetes sp. JL221]|nr:hypothetical protein OIO90_006342 [Microbotryomycetes sp. JL221]
MSNVAAKQEALLEFAALGTEPHCPTGMYVTPAYHDPFTWHGVQFVHRGFFAGAVLHFVIEIPTTYPSNPPTVVYRSTSLVHPLVNPATGQVKLETRFPKWKPRQDFIVHVLHFLKSLFKRQTLDELKELDCVNIEAYQLYRERHDVFVKLASQSALLSTTDNALYGDSKDVHKDDVVSPIKFRHLDDEEDQQLRQQLQEQVLARLR